MTEVVLPEALYSGPSVFAVEDTYQITVPAKSPMLFWIEIDGKKYYDHSNGILKSSNPVHRVTVPMEELDRVKKYSVNYRKIIERKPYYTESEEPVCMEIPFRPVEAEKKALKLYHISDSHGLVYEAIDAEKKSGLDEDLLVLNGDVANDSGSLENILGIYEIAWKITKGEYPCVFSRGNHDLRGAFAEKLEEYTPTRNGLSYFTFKVGDLWGLVLDCGEDKTDDHAEYGFTVCCHQFREDETAFLEEIIEKEAYKDPSIKHKIVICHVPFSFDDTSSGGIFDIEKDTYTRWCRLLSEIDPDIMLCGHTHLMKICRKGDPEDNKGQPCTVVWGGSPSNLKGERGFTGASFTLKEKTVKVSFNDNTGEVIDGEEFSYR